MKFTMEQARKLADISQNEMAKLMGMPKMTYCNKEWGKVRMYYDEAMRFAEIVKIPHDDIIFLSKV